MRSSTNTIKNSSTSLFDTPAVEANAFPLPGIRPRNGFRYRSGQFEFLQKLSEAFQKGEYNHIGVFVPGYGKTITALSSFLIAKRLDIADRVVIFVPRGNLRDQYADEKDLAALFRNLDAPLLSFAVADSERAFLKNLNTDIIITTYQYASAKGGHKAMKEFTSRSRCLFIFDEVHHLSEDGTWAASIKSFPHTASVALSGTPLRSDNKTLFGVPFEARLNAEGKPENYYVALHEVSLREAHAEGKILKKVSVHAIDYKIKLQNTLSKEEITLSLDQIRAAGERSSDIDAFLARKQLRFHDVYLHALLSPAFEAFADKRDRLARKRQANLCGGSRQHQLLVIAMSNAHAEAMLAFIKENFPQFSSARIGQDIPQKEREQLLAEYRSGSLDVMVQVDMIGEGTDIKPISVIVKADLVRAFSKTLQQIFRGMRYCADFDEEDNLCDIFASNDTEVVAILDWLAGEEEKGLTIKTKRENVDFKRGEFVPQENFWELSSVEHKATETLSLELFPDFARPAQLKRTSKTQPSTPPPPQVEEARIVNVAAREQELRQECSILAVKLANIFRAAGRVSEIKHIHAVAKRRYAKPQEQMSLPELEDKLKWLDSCIRSRKIVH